MFEMRGGGVVRPSVPSFVRSVRPFYRHGGASISNKQDVSSPQINETLQRETSVGFNRSCNDNMERGFRAGLAYRETLRGESYYGGIVFESCFS